MFKGKSSKTNHRIPQLPVLPVRKLLVYISLLCLLEGIGISNEEFGSIPTTLVLRNHKSKQHGAPKQMRTSDSGPDKVVYILYLIIIYYFHIFHIFIFIFICNHGCIFQYIHTFASMICRTMSYLSWNSDSFREPTKNLCNNMPPLDESRSL